MKNPFERFLGGKDKKDQERQEQREREKKESLEYLNSLSPAHAWTLLNQADGQRPLNAISEDITPPEKFDSVRVEKVFSSKELQRAFELMWARVGAGVEGINNKKKIILEINERKLLDREILSKGSTVYIGSGTDIEFPLLAGARNITMVDYGYNYPEDYFKDLSRRIKVIIGEKEIKIEGNQMSFDLDVGEGKVEKVSVTFEAKQVVGGPFPVEKERFVPKEEIALLMSYAPAGLLNLDPKLMQKVGPGGYILTDSMFIGDEAMKYGGFERKLFTTEELKDMKLFQRLKEI